MISFARPNTLQAVREIIGDALTVPPLTWTIDDGSVFTLPARNVVPKAIWQTSKTPPMPLIAYTVSKGAATSQYLWGESNLTVKIWVVSAIGEDEATQIYAAVAARLDRADNQGSLYADLSRVKSGTKAGAMIRTCRETRASEPGYERDSSRWYITAEYHVAAI